MPTTEDRPNGLTLADILNADDVKIQKITIEDWGGDVYIRSIPALRALEINNYEPKMQNIYLVAYSLCDKNANLLCQSKEDADKVVNKDVSVLVSLIDPVVAINGIDGEAIEKKSGKTPS